MIFAKDHILTDFKQGHKIYKVVTYFMVFNIARRVAYTVPFPYTAFDGTGENPPYNGSFVLIAADSFYNFLRAYLFKIAYND